MSGKICCGWFSPHPPIIIPAVGKGEEASAAATGDGMREAAAAVARFKPETVLVCGPHGPLFSDSFTLDNQALLSGGFGDFGAPQEQMTVSIDLDLVDAILRFSYEDDLPMAALGKELRQSFGIPNQLDHGALLPLWFLRQAMAGSLPPVVLVNVSGLTLLQHYKLGMAIQRAVKASGKRVVIIGSGDLSHRLAPESADYHPQAHFFDRGVAELLKSGRVEDLLQLEKLAQNAGECGLRPLAVYLGAFEGLAGKHELLSYEAPWGVGYLVALRKVEEGPGDFYAPLLQGQLEQEVSSRRSQESAPVSLARLAVETYVKSGSLPRRLPGLPPPLPKEAGAFVTIYRHGQLRGCIGTTEPTQLSLAEEIAHNAVSAAGDDPRFDPVDSSELPDLIYSVDILEAPEPISHTDCLDPQIYGVVVERGRRRGLLLPDLPGIDSVEEQVAVARNKAGIPPGAQVSLYRFRVTRYH